MGTGFSKKKREPTVIGGARNTHGTRICKRVTCEKCGSEDFIAARPKSGKGVFCRECAKGLLLAFEPSVHIPVPALEAKCGQCGTVFALPEKAKKQDDETWLCIDCLRGFEVWRGSLAHDPSARGTGTLEVRSPGLMLRRKPKV